MKSYTDIEQSKKLAEILPIESADMYYFLDPTPAGNIYHIVIPRIDFGVRTKEPEYNEGDIPCWSLNSLIYILPDTITDEEGTIFGLNIKKNFIEYYNPSLGALCATYHSIIAEDLVDACYEMILKLHELKLL